MSTRLAVYGFSGSGKSTFAGLLRRVCEESGRRCAVVKLAEPLYRLQRTVYATAGVPVPDGAQDQLLMEALAAHLRRINPHALADDFVDRLTRTDADLILNDDLRDPHVDAPELRSHGFVLVRITCGERLRRQRLAARQDLSVAADEPSAQGLDTIVADVTLHNDGSLDALAARARELLAGTR